MKQHQSFPGHPTFPHVPTPTPMEQHETLLHYKALTQTPQVVLERWLSFSKSILLTIVDAYHGRKEGGKGTGCSKVLSLILIFD